MGSASPLRMKINLAIVATCLVIAGVFSIFLVLYEKQRRENAVDRMNHSLAEVVAQHREELSNQVFAGHRRAAEETLQQMTRHQQVVSATVFDVEGEPFASTEQTEPPPKLTEKEQAALPEGGCSLVYASRGEHVLTYTTAINAYGEDVGYCQLDYSMAGLHGETLTIVAIFAGMLLVLLILLSVLLNILLSKLVLQPVQKLERTMGWVIGNDVQGARMDPEARVATITETTAPLDAGAVFSHQGNEPRDEIESLSISFRKMLCELQNTYGELLNVEEKYRGIIENAAEGIFQITPEGRILMANHAMARICGFDGPGQLKEQVRSMGTQLFSGFEQWETFVNELRTHGRVWNFESQLRRKAEDTVWVQFTAHVIRDAASGINLIEGMMEDITERKKAQQALKESEKNLRLTLDSIGDAVISTDLEGRIVRMNPVGEKLTGWHFEEAEGKYLTEIVSIRDSGTQAEIYDPVQRVRENGKIVDLGNQTVLTAKDGKEYQIADSGAPIKDDDGRITGVVLVFRDITDEVQIREALRQSEEQLRRAQSVAELGSWQLDLKTREITASPEAYRIYGLEEEKTLTLDEIKRLTLPEYRSELDEKLEKLLNDQDKYDVEYKIKRPADGSIRHIHNVAERNLQNNNIVGVIQDITEQKQTEAELQKMDRLKSVATLAGGIAHDFNNVLTRAQAHPPVLMTT